MCIVEDFQGTDIGCCTHGKFNRARRAEGRLLRRGGCPTRARSAIAQQMKAIARVVATLALAKLASCAILNPRENRGPKAGLERLAYEEDPVNSTTRGLSGKSPSGDICPTISDMTLWRDLRRQGNRAS